MKNDFPKLGGFSFLFWGKIVESGRTFKNEVQQCIRFFIGSNL